MPETVPQRPTPETPKPEKKAAPSSARDTAPIVSAWRKTRDGVQNTYSKWGEKGQRFDEKSQNILRMEGAHRDVEAENLIIPPMAGIKSVGDVIETGVAVPTRAAYRVTRDTAKFAWASLRVLGMPLRPFKTIFHPFKSVGKLLNVPFKGLKLAGTIVKTPIDVVGEAADGVVKRPLQRHGKIPLLKHIGKGVGFLANIPRKIFELPGKLIDKVKTKFQKEPEE